MEVNKIYQGDCLEVLKTFDNDSIDCVVTSPPYYGLRDYGTATWEGGDSDCKHREAKEKSRYDYKMQEGSRHSEISKTTNGTDGARWKEYCPKCGAIRIDNQLGLEKTFHEYLDKLIEVFAEVKRVLKPTGTIWVNLGDSYGGSGNDEYKKEGERTKSGLDKRPVSCSTAGNRKNTKGLEKCLLQIPARFAIMMTDELGFILRNEIIWHKKNCMPASVTDRFTVDFEYLFFFTKNRKYYFEQQFEDFISNGYDRKRMEQRKEYTGKWDKGYNSMLNPQRAFVAGNQQGRNKRTVWQISTQPYKEAHFATYPEKLIDIPIKAGCPENGIVLDPFFGSGTTGVVALKQNKNFIGIELNPDYIKLAEKRLEPYLTQLKLAI